MRRIRTRRGPEALDATVPSDRGLARRAKQGAVIHRFECQHLAFGGQRRLDLRKRRSGARDQCKRARFVERDARQASHGQVVAVDGMADRARAAATNRERPGSSGHCLGKFAFVNWSQHWTPRGVDIMDVSLSGSKLPAVMLPPAGSRLRPRGTPWRDSGARPDQARP